MSPSGRDGDGQGDTAIEVSFVERGDLDALIEPWRALSTRSLEPNVLHGPDVLGPALTAFAPSARVAVAWRGAAMVGLLPLWMPRMGFGLFDRLPTLFSNEFTPLGTPLIDADRPVATARALLDAVAAVGKGLVLPHLTLDGPVATAFAQAVRMRGDRWSLAERHDRAALLAATDDATAEAEARARFDGGIRRKRRKEWARQWRRLIETGTITVTSVRGAAARAAFADFLVLEASGWKGRAGTALVQSQTELTFGENVVAALAEHDGVVIDRIDRRGQALAMLVNFGVGGHYVTWKTAYDEAFSTFSPGAQVFLRASARFLVEPMVTVVDSLAVADHPLLSHMWRDALAIGTVVIGFGSPARGARLVALDIEWHDRIRRTARRIRDRWFS